MNRRSCVLGAPVHGYCIKIMEIILLKFAYSFFNLTCILLMHHTIRYLLILEITVLVSHLKKEKYWILKSNICNQYANFLNKYHSVFLSWKYFQFETEILMIESWMFTIKFLGYHLGWLLQNCRTKRYCGLCFDWPGTLLIKTKHSKRRQSTPINYFKYIYLSNWNWQ